MVRFSPITHMVSGSNPLSARFSAGVRRFPGSVYFHAYGPRGVFSPIGLI